MGRRAQRPFVWVLAAAFLAAASAFAAPKPVPKVAIVSPADGFATNQNALDIVVAFEAAEPGGPPVRDIDLLKDGQVLQTHVNPASVRKGTHTFHVDLSVYPEGTVVFTASAFAGNRRTGFSATSAAVHVLIDRTSPEIRCLVPEQDAEVEEARPAMSAIFSDSSSGVDVASVRIVLDGTDVTAQAVVTATGFRFTPAADLAQGAHTLAVDLKDLAGNAAPRAESVFRVAPITSIAITRLPCEVRAGASFSIEVTAFKADGFPSSSFAGMVLVQAPTEADPASPLSGAGILAGFSRGRATLSGSLVTGGAHTLRATLVGGPAGVDPAERGTTALPGAPASVTIVASAQRQELSLFAADLTVTIRDGSGNGVFAAPLEIRSSAGAVSSPVDQGDGTYTAVLTSDSAAAITVTAQSGPAMAATVVSFTGALDADSPRVLSFDPPDDATLVLETAQVRVVFSEAVDPTTVVNKQTFFVTDLSTGRSLDGSLVVAGDTATFTPAAPMTFEAQHSVFLTAGVKDPVGHPLDTAGASAGFTVKPEIFPPDTEPPFIVSTSPANGATDVPNDTLISVTYNEPLSSGSFRFVLDGLRFIDPSTEGVVTFSDDRKTLTWTPAVNLPLNRTIQVVTGFVRDLSGNTFFSFDSFVFTIEAADTRGPRVVSVTPADASTGLREYGTVRLTFSEPLLPASATPERIRIEKAGVPVDAAVTLSQSNRVAEITPTAFLEPETDYRVVVDGALTDVLGNPFDQVPGGAPDPFTSAFRTGPADTVPPFVTSVTPADDAEDVSTLLGSARVTFSQEIAPASVVPGTLQILKGATPIPATATLAADRLSATLAFGELERDTLYTIRVSGLRDRVGNVFDQTPGGAADPFTSTFRTIVQDVVGPRVVLASPANNATNVPVESLVELTFNEPVQLLRPPNVSFGAIPGLWSLSADGLKATFVPDANLPVSTHVSVFVNNFAGPMFVDLAGNAFQQNPGGDPSFFLSFSTASADAAGPRVVASFPVADARDVSVCIHVVLDFSESLAPASVGPDSFKLEKGADRVAGTVTLENLDRRLVFTPSAFLDNLSAYTMTFGSGATDVAGNPFDQVPGGASDPFSAAFETGALDLTGPRVVSIDPAPGSSSIVETSRIRITFDEPVDPATANALTIQVKDAGNRLVAGSYAFEEANTVVVFTPVDPLALGTDFTVTVSGLKDCVGNDFDQVPGGGSDPFTSTFQTTRVDRVPPKVTSVMPEDGKKLRLDEVPGLEIVATTDEPIQPSTVNSRTVFLHAFRFLDFEGSFFGPNRINLVVNVPGELSVDPDNRTIRFKPDPGEMEDLSKLLLDTGFAFTFEVTPGVTDLAGNPLDQKPAPGLQGFLSEFLIQNPFKVISVSPEDGATKVPTGSGVRVTFNAFPDPSTVDASTFVVKVAGSPVDGFRFVSFFDRAAVFFPSRSLRGHAEHTVDLPAGGVRAADEEPLFEAFHSSFETDFSSTNPVVSVDPPDGAEGVALSAPVTVVFEEEIDPTRVSEGGILDVGDFQGTVALTNPTTLRFEPATGYFLGISVPVSVSRIGFFSSSFSTQPLPSGPIAFPQFMFGGPVVFGGSIFVEQLPPLDPETTYRITAVTGATLLSSGGPGERPSGLLFIGAAISIPAGASGDATVTVSTVMVDEQGMEHVTSFATLPFTIVQATVTPDWLLLRQGELSSIHLIVEPASAIPHVELESSPNILLGPSMGLQGEIPVRAQSVGIGLINPRLRYDRGDRGQNTHFQSVAVFPNRIGRNNFEPKDATFFIGQVDASSRIAAITPSDGLEIVSQSVFAGTLTAVLRLDPSTPFGTKDLKVSLDHGILDLPVVVFGAEAFASPGGGGGPQAIRFSDLTPTVTFTSPGDGPAALTSQDPPRVRVRGEVTDPVADVTPDHKADPTTIVINGQRIALTPMPPSPTETRPFAFKATFDHIVKLQEGSNVVTAQVVNAIQKKGVDQLAVVVQDADGDPGTPALSARIVNADAGRTGPQHPVFLEYHDAHVAGTEAEVTVGLFRRIRLTRSGDSGPFKGGPFLFGSVHQQISAGAFFGSPQPFFVSDGIPAIFAELGSLELSQGEAKLRVAGAEIRPVDRSGRGNFSDFDERNLGDHLLAGEFVHLVVAPAGTTQPQTIQATLEALDPMGGMPMNQPGEAPFSQPLTLTKQGDAYETEAASPLGLVSHPTAANLNRPLQRIITGGSLKLTAGMESDSAMTWDLLRRNVKRAPFSSEPFLSFIDAPQESIRGTTPSGGGGGSVWLHNGEFHHTMTDLRIPGVGFPFEITRTFRNQITYESLFGVNWDCTLNMRLIESRSFFFSAGGGGELTQGLMFFDGTGRVDFFAVDPRNNEYLPPNGWYVTLVKEPSGSYLLTDRHATKFRFAQVNPAFRSYAQLISIEDRNGNRLDIHHDAQGRMDKVTDTLGRDILFFYEHDTQKHLVTKIKDFTGREVIYDYNDANELIFAGKPANADPEVFKGTNEHRGKGTRYTYSSGHDPATKDFLNHNLLTITDPKGQNYLENVYGGEDKVLTQRYGAHSYGFEYEPSGKTTVTNRRGNRTAWVFPPPDPFLDPVPPVPTSRTEFTRGLRPEDPASYLTKFQHNVEEELVSVTLPEKNRVLYTFDHMNPDRRKRGNTKEVRQVADAKRGLDSRGAAAPDLVTTIEHDPKFNFAKKVTDPRGFTTENVFDYEELDKDQGGVREDGLGDFNRDGHVGPPPGGRIAGNIIGVIHPFVPTRVEGTAFATMQQPIERMAVNARGQVLFSLDPEDDKDAYEYFPAGDPKGREGYLFKVTRDAGGLNLATEYDVDKVGNILEVKPPKGNATTYEVNELNLATKMTSPSPQSYVTDYLHDANDSVREIQVENKKADGNVDMAFPVIHTKFERDILDNLTLKQEEVVAGKFIDTRYGYDAEDNPTDTFLPEKNRVHSEFDERELLLSATRGFGAVGASTTTYGYTPNRNSAFVEDANLHRTTMRQDGFDRQVESEDAEKNLSLQVLDPGGNVVRTQRRGPTGFAGDTPALLAQTDFTVDALGRVNLTDSLWFNTKTGAALGAGSLHPGHVLTANLYTLRSLLEAVVDDNGHVSEREHDGAGRARLSRDALGNEVESLFDLNSNPQFIVERERSQKTGEVKTFTTENVLDNQDRVKATIDPLGHCRESGFDSRSNAVAFTDAKGNTSRSLVDGLSRQTLRELDLRTGGGAPGSVSRTIRMASDWDGNSRLKEQRDDNGNPTKTGFDAQDRAEKKTTADGLCSADNAFSPTGVALKVTDANGTVVEITRIDKLDRVLERRVTKSGGGVAKTTTFETFAWNGLSQQVRTENDLWVTETVLDSLSRTIEEHATDKAMGRVHVTLTTTDGVGNVLAIGYPSGRRITQEHNAGDQMTSIKENGGAEIAGYKYVGPGRVEERRSGNGVVLDVLYDAGRRATDLQHTLGGGLIAGFHYGFDEEDNRLFEKRLHEGGSGDRYVQDSLYRLVGAELGLADPELAGGTPRKTLAWELDGVSNRNTESVNGSPRSYAPNNLNQYAAVDGLSQGHDASGNSQGTRHAALRHDFRHRLAEAKGLRVDNQAPQAALSVDSEEAFFEKERLTDTVLGDSTAPLGGWKSASSGGQHEAQLAWGSPRTISEARLLVPTAPGPIRRFKLQQWSLFASAWVDLEACRVSGAQALGDSFFEGLSGAHEIVFGLHPAIQTRAIRYLQEANSGPAFDLSRAHLNEIEVNLATPFEASYEFDASGRRRAKVVNGVRTVFLCHGSRIIEERDGSTDAVLASHAWGNGIDELVQTVSNPGTAAQRTYYFHGQAIGSITHATDEIGRVVETYSYEPFGEPTIRNASGQVITSSAIGNRHLFTGREWDEELGLYHYRARWMDPRTGRFGQRDPRGFDGLRNAYAYVRQNAINRNDPKGLYDPDDVERIFIAKYGNTLLRTAADLGYNWDRDGGAENPDDEDWSVDPVTKTITIDEFSDAQAADHLFAALLFVRGRVASLATLSAPVTSKSLSSFAGSWAKLQSSGSRRLYGRFPEIVPEDEIVAAELTSRGQLTKAQLGVEEQGKQAAAGMATAALGARVLASARKLSKSKNLGEAHNRALFEKYLQTLREQMSKPSVVDKDLLAILDDAYRPGATVGSGSTAAAIRRELQTGKAVNEAFHSQKGSELITRLGKWLRLNPTASSGDRAAAENVVRDIQDALGH